jgi:hypothetical protein
MGEKDMRRIGIAIVLCAGCATTGCTSGMFRADALTHIKASGRALSPPSVARAARSSVDRSPTQDDGIVWAADEQASPDQAIATDEIAATIETPTATQAEEVIPTPKSDRSDLVATASHEEPAPTEAEEVIPTPKSDPPSITPDPSDAEPTLTQGKEEIPAPQPDSALDVLPGGSDDDQDRFARRVTDVRLDIRPPQGALPPDLAADEADKNAAQPSEPEEPCACEKREPIICAFTPWTICYRPLYFEDISLERYGRTFGIVQPGVSAVRFFCTVPLMPYKMTVRRPRSCECSNGFSRLGDQPLPGYGARFLRLDAAAVEAAVMAGLFLALP